ncbi:MAG: HAD family hydrolase [Candidatus Cloacimonadales bacterium]|nr:HAD family hydrolase [Candidatus Cloacimonadales bacterium]
MKRNEIKIVFTDLDRTLLRDDNTFSDKSLKALENLQRKGIVVVIATGRNIYSASKVLPDDLPFNYLMISSGCGIIDWKTKEVIYENHLDAKEIIRVFDIFISRNVDFMLHHPIPENHYFDYIRKNQDNQDFERRIVLYKSFARELIDLPDKASQFIAILPPGGNAKFEAIKQEIDFLKVIRATSPLDHELIWLEVFPNGVSKGHSAQWLCDRLGIGQQFTLGIGNDFNDLDLLEFTAHSCVVANAPEELKEIYNVIDSNQHDGFAKCMEKMLL